MEAPESVFAFEFELEPAVDEPESEPGVLELDEDDAAASFAEVADAV